MDLDDNDPSGDVEELKREVMDDFGGDPKRRRVDHHPSGPPGVSSFRLDSFLPLANTSQTAPMEPHPAETS